MAAVILQNQRSFLKVSHGEKSVIKLIMKCSRTGEESEKLMKHKSFLFYPRLQMKVRSDKNQK